MKRLIILIFISVTLIGCTREDTLTPPTDNDLVTVDVSDGLTEEAEEDRTLQSEVNNIKESSELNESEVSDIAIVEKGTDPYSFGEAYYIHIDTQTNVLSNRDDETSVIGNVDRYHVFKILTVEENLVGQTFIEIVGDNNCHGWINGNDCTPFSNHEDRYSYLVRQNDVTEDVAFITQSNKIEIEEYYGKDSFAEAGYADAGLGWFRLIDNPFAIVYEYDKDVAEEVPDYIDIIEGGSVHDIYPGMSFNDLIFKYGYPVKEISKYEVPDSDRVVDLEYGYYFFDGYVVRIQISEGFKSIVTHMAVIRNRDESGWLEIRATDLNIRAYGSTLAPSIGLAEDGNIYKYYGVSYNQAYDREWFVVTHEGNTGYIAGDYIKRITEVELVEKIKNNHIVENYEVIEVSNAEEFIGKIGDNKILILKKGINDLNDNLISADNAVIEVDNFMLIGDDEDQVDFLTSDLYRSVIKFKDSSNVILANLNIGHEESVKEKVCRGDVVNLDRCSNITIIDSTLIGCGTIGIQGNFVSNLKVVDSVIRHCTNEMVLLKNSNQLSFTECLVKNDFQQNLVFTKSSGISFANTILEGKLDSSPSIIIDSKAYQEHRMLDPVLETKSFKDDKLTLTNVISRNMDLNRVFDEIPIVNVKLLEHGRMEMSGSPMTRCVVILDDQTPASDYLLLFDEVSDRLLKEYDDGSGYYTILLDIEIGEDNKVTISKDYYYTGDMIIEGEVLDIDQIVGGDTEYISVSKALDETKSSYPNFYEYTQERIFVQVNVVPIIRLDTVRLTDEGPYYEFSVEANYSDIWLRNIGYFTSIQSMGMEFDEYVFREVTEVDSDLKDALFDYLEESQDLPEIGTKMNIISIENQFILVEGTNGFHRSYVYTNRNGQYIFESRQEEDAG